MTDLLFQGEKENRAAPKFAFGKTISSYWVERGLPNFTREVLLDGANGCL